MFKKVHHPHHHTPQASATQRQATQVRQLRAQVKAKRANPEVLQEAEKTYTRMSTRLDTLSKQFDEEASLANTLMKRLGMAGKSLPRAADVLGRWWWCVGWCVCRVAVGVCKLCTDGLQMVYYCIHIHNPPRSPYISCGKHISSSNNNNTHHHTRSQACWAWIPMLMSSSPIKPTQQLPTPPHPSGPLLVCNLAHHLPPPPPQHNQQKQPRGVLLLVQVLELLGMHYPAAAHQPHHLV